MRLLCLGNIALDGSPYRLPAWESPAGFAPGPSTRLLTGWQCPLPEPLSISPRRTGPLGKWGEAVGSIQKWTPGIAALADIHALPAREAASASTLLMLQQAGFRTLGAGRSEEETTRPLLWGTAEGELTILNWTLTRPENPAELHANVFPGTLEAGRVIQSLRQTSDWVMVVIHWGGEPSPHTPPAHRELAAQLASLGADIVIGQDPSGVRGMEFVEGRPVFYGLGTFYSSTLRHGEGMGEPFDPLGGQCSLGVHFNFQHGLPPVYEFTSFWSDRNGVLLDPAGRALRRLNSASHILHSHPPRIYPDWYASERARMQKKTGPLAFVSSMRKK